MIWTRPLKMACHTDKILAKDISWDLSLCFIFFTSVFNRKHQIITKIITNHIRSTRELKKITCILSMLLLEAETIQSKYSTRVLYIDPFTIQIYMQVHTWMSPTTHRLHNSTSFNACKYICIKVLRSKWSRLMCCVVYRKTGWPTNWDNSHWTHAQTSLDSSQ